jgi:tetratricopeptide (TPR) repeat protein
MRSILVGALLVSAVSGSAGAESLGKIEFPTTGTAPARAHFVRGVLALHSFFYDEALDEFRAATQAEPAFAMGYWGEAMAHNHTIWDQQDTEAARAALGKIGDTSRLKARERAWIAAVRLLYGDGAKPARDRAYAQALEKMARDYPDDLEVASFEAVALLGTLDPEEPGLATRMRAGAIALEVLAKNPDHPGAAHYVIHAFDDADHARIALPAARRYAQIAPAAFHARHMPAHIFVNLGMWDEAAAANESAFAASEVWVAKRKHPVTKLDFHSLGWLAAIYHQQGRMKKSEEILAKFARLVDDSGEVSVAVSYTYVVGVFLERTGRWAELEHRLAPTARAVKEASAMEPSCHPTPKIMPKLFLALLGARLQAEAAAERGDDAAVEKNLAAAAEVAKRFEGTPAGPDVAAASKIGDLEIRARLLRTHHHFDAAEKLLRDAVALAERRPFHAGADPAGLAVETALADLLIEAGKTKDAQVAYAAALRVTPGDSLALLGAARAAHKLGDDAGAAALYAKVAAQWKNADDGFPDLQEVRAGAGKKKETALR